jgi:glycosyltransferase involved in cell wall biosynthesis
MSAAQPPIAVSALVITYCHKAFVAEALQTILAQQGPDFEIVASDDCSPDGTLAEIERIAAATGGQRRFVVSSTPRNSGLASNLNNAVAQARGAILVACAGDDRSRPGRFARLVAAMGVHEDGIFAVTTDAMKIDAAGRETGHEPGWQHGGAIEAMAFVVPGVATNGAAMAYRREVFDLFGPLDAGVNWEDQVLPFRAALLGKVVWLKESLVEHRYHGANMSTPIDLPVIAPAEFARRWIESARANSRILAQKRKDLQRFIALRPDKADSLAQLGRALERWHNLQLLCGTVRERPWRAVLTLLVLTMRGRLPFRLAAKQLLMGRFPALWLWHVRRTSGMALPPPGI